MVGDRVGLPPALLILAALPAVAALLTVAVPRVHEQEQHT
jgi:hypothetical protein